MTSTAALDILVPVLQVIVSSVSGFGSESDFEHLSELTPPLLPKCLQQLLSSAKSGLYLVLALAYLRLSANHNLKISTTLTCCQS
jgi:hypothetical protein